MKASRIIILVAAAVLAVAIGLFLAALRPDKIAIYVPTRDIGAYERIDQDADLKKIEVLKDQEELRKYALTRDYVAKKLKDHKGVIYFQTKVYKDEHVDSRKLTGASRGSLSVVTAPEERVVPVSISSVDSSIGLVQPGDVVTIVGGSGGSLAEFAKVIAVGVGSEIGAGVIGDTENKSGSGGESEEEQAQSGGSGLTILVAVPSAEAEAIALDNQGVSLVYNPFCKVQADGSIQPINEEAAGACPETANAPNAPAATPGAGAGAGAGADDDAPAGGTDESGSATGAGDEEIAATELNTEESGQ